MRVIRGLAVLIALAAGGCAWPDWRSPYLPHEHHNYCGHAYLQDVHLNPCPRDFAGADAWRGPLYENEIRWRDPYRGNNRPAPDESIPADRIVPRRPEESRGLPVWPPEPATGTSER